MEDFIFHLNNEARKIFNDELDPHHKGVHNAVYIFETQTSGSLNQRIRRFGGGSYTSYEYRTIRAHQKSVAKIGYSENNAHVFYYAEEDLSKALKGAAIINEIIHYHPECEKTLEQKQKLMQYIMSWVFNDSNQWYSFNSSNFKCSTLEEIEIGNIKDGKTLPPEGDRYLGAIPNERLNAMRAVEKEWEQPVVNMLDSLNTTVEKEAEVAKQFIKNIKNSEISVPKAFYAAVDDIIKR